MLEREGLGECARKRKQKENGRKRCFLLAWRRRSPEAAGSAAVLARARKRGPSVLECLRTEEDAAMQSGGGRSKRAKVVAATAESSLLEASGGKSRGAGRQELRTRGSVQRARRAASEACSERSEACSERGVQRARRAECEA